MYPLRKLVTISLLVLTESFAGSAAVANVSMLASAAFEVRGPRLPSLEHRGNQICLESSSSFARRNVFESRGDVTRLLDLFVSCLLACDHTYTNSTRLNSTQDYVSCYTRSHSVNYLQRYSDNMAESQPDESLSDDLSNLALAAPKPEPLGLCYLPVELLDAIVTFLDQQSLCALILTCKATKNSASQALYTTYVNRDAPSKKPFHLFLRTLCESPELAAMVKALDIRGWRSEFETATGLPWVGITKDRPCDNLPSGRAGPLFSSTNKTATKTSVPRKLFEKTAVTLGLVPEPVSSSTPSLKKSAVLGSSLNKDDDFIRLLRHDIEDAHLVLMLALVPNFMGLCVDGMSTSPILDWHHFLKKSNYALRHVRELHILGHSAAGRRSVHTTSMAFLALTPKLERLVLFDVNVKASRQASDLLTEKKLRCFDAIHCLIAPKVLRNMLAGQKITEFNYRPAIGRIESESEGNDYAEDLIIDCLTDSLPHLRKIDLYSTFTSKAPRLSQCDNLEFLEMPFQYGFLDVAETETEPHNLARSFRMRIPDSLSVLTFRYVHPSDDVPIAMRILTDLKAQGEFPGLKTVRLNFSRYNKIPWYPPVPFEDMTVSAMETFGEAMEKVGIQLEVAQTD